VHISIELCASKQKRSCIKTAEEFVYSTMRSDHSTSLLVTFSDEHFQIISSCSEILLLALTTCVRVKWCKSLHVYHWPCQYLGLHIQFSMKVLHFYLLCKFFVIRSFRLGYNLIIAYLLALNLVERTIARHPTILWEVMKCSPTCNLDKLPPPACCYQTKVQTFQFEFSSFRLILQGEPFRVPTIQ
jgi:hypothetical protein